MKVCHAVQIAVAAAVVPDLVLGIHRVEIDSLGISRSIDSVRVAADELVVVTPPPLGGGTAPFVRSQRYPDMEYFSKRTASEDTLHGEKTQPCMGSNSTNCTGATSANSTAGPRMKQAVAAAMDKDDASVADAEAGTGRRDTKQKPDGYFRQTMKNGNDMQYTSEITVGGQTLDGILDTGSFELLVFSTACPHCGDSALLYNPTQSASYNRSHEIEKVHHFGSGDCASQLAYDNVGVGQDTVSGQYFWEVTGAQLGGLLYSGEPFQAIVGVGPPNEPKEEAAAKGALADSAIHKVEDSGQDAPDYLVGARDDNLYLMEQKTLTESLDVSVYSVCLGREPDSSGYFIWNDYDPRAMPDGMFTEVRVVGEYHWEVFLTSVTMKDGNAQFNSALACEDGCGAILDSGTSLIVVPTEVADLMLVLLNSYPNYDCSDLSTFPSLSFMLDGSSFSLPPESYISVVEGDLPAGPFLYKRRSLLPRDSTCSLAVMTMEDQGERGPTWIFGMPFFRYYYSTFSLGADPVSKAGRSIFLAPANDQCEPQQDKSLVQTGLVRTPRRIDLSKAMWPRWLHAGRPQAPAYPYSS